MTKAGTGTMRRVAAGITLAATVAWTGVGETVTNVRGVQRPNSNLVDIYYDLNAVDGWSYMVEVAIEGRTNEVTATTFSGDVGKGIAPGKNRHIVWEAGADWRGKKGDVKAIVTATIIPKEKKDKHNKVQLWEGGPYWATTNIGADNPWDYGLYFWWGDTVGHRPSSGGTFSFNFTGDNSIIYTYGKSVSELQSSGWVTADGVLAPSHDAAHVKWGGCWRMPTKDESEDLGSKCDWTWTTRNGVKGYKVCGRGVYASNSIFLPAAGWCMGTEIYEAGRVGSYWSSVPASDDGGACEPRFDSENGPGINISRRFRGRSIRPVQGFTSTVEAATGSSGWFFVDTTDGALKVADVRSNYFDGEYGGVGRKATFLNGVSCDIEMRILMDDYSKVDHWLVNGREVTTYRRDIRACHPEVGDVRCSLRQNPRVRSLHMRMRPDHRGDFPVQ